MDWRELIPEIVCPACRQPLHVRLEEAEGKKAEHLDCAGCRRSYPVRDNIPILLIDQATIKPK